MLTQEDPWEEGKLGSNRTRGGKRDGERWIENGEEGKRDGREREILVVSIRAMKTKWQKGG